MAGQPYPRHGVSSGFFHTKVVTKVNVSSLRPCRRTRLVTGAVSVGMLGMLVAPAATAATPLPPQPLPPQPAHGHAPLGVTMGPNGWIEYTDPVTSSLASAASRTQELSGTKNATGTCVFHASRELSPGTPAMFEVETAFNPSTCQERLVLGRATAATSSALNQPPSNGTGQSASTTIKASSSSAQTAVSPAYAGSASGYQKSEWIDPFGITITSIADDLYWSYNGYSWTYASAHANSYEFPYDGWSNSGLPGIQFQYPGDGSIRYYEHEQFVNTDFEEYVLITFGLAGLAACGFSTAPAVFNLDPGVRGYGNGNLGGAYYDSVSGGCSDLVHHGSEFGYGYIT